MPVRSPSIILLLSFSVFAFVLGACFKRNEALTAAVPATVVSEDKVVLFGDLHVHSTYSVDAFMMNLPLMSGEGVRPLSEACDFARYCSGLDFWATTEHAESITQKSWREIRDQMRACDAAGAADGQPQTIVYTGFEWTQWNPTPEKQYGHKNVIFKYLDDDRLPTRPIAMGAFPLQAAGKADPAGLLYLVALLDIAHPLAYTTLSSYVQDLQKMKSCPPGVDTKKLPADCMEVAPDAATLFEKLNQWDLDTLVIPHGTAWGLHVPINADWKTQLKPKVHDAKLQRLFEVYSGHGASEQMKSWSEYTVAPNGDKVCPAPTKEYQPCCHRAGEIVRERCADAKSVSCDQEVKLAEQKFMAAGLRGFRTVPNSKPEDWLACGQCTDCFSPAFNYRPKGTVQRALAVSEFDSKGEPARFTFGFIGSSDTHRSSPGSGISEKRSLADGAFPRNVLVAKATGGALSPAIDWEFERQGSFWYTGGLAAVHAKGKSREAIWDAMQRRETYATSGPRILLWMDLLNDASGEPRPMGAEASVKGSPRFEVRAVGAFQQKPGCPADTLNGGDAETRDKICRGACYNPTDERIPITRLEIVKIRPQISPDEAVAPLIQDPWKVIACEDKGAGCKIQFEDPEFSAGGRQALYYVRAIQAPTPGVNSGMLRCEYDDQGRCIKVNPCHGDYRTAKDDQCFSPTEERAWSSPIYVEPSK